VVLHSPPTSLLHPLLPPYPPPKKKQTNTLVLSLLELFFPLPRRYEVQNSMRSSITIGKSVTGLMLLIFFFISFLSSSCFPSPSSLKKHTKAASLSLSLSTFTNSESKASEKNQNDNPAEKTGKKHRCRGSATALWRIQEEKSKYKQTLLESPYSFISRHASIALESLSEAKEKQDHLIGKQRRRGLTAGIRESDERRIMLMDPSQLLDAKVYSILLNSSGKQNKNKTQFVKKTTLSFSLSLSLFASSAHRCRELIIGYILSLSLSLSPRIFRSPLS